EAYSNVAVRAQTTGELISVNFKEGDDVRKGQVLFTLDRRPLEAALAQAEANLSRDIAQAQNARAQAARVQDLAARGIATREQLDQSTGTIKLKGTFANENRHLWPGQFVNVVVALTSEPHAVVVPTPAVQTGQQGQFVFVVKSDQTVELRPVTATRSIGAETVIDN